MTPEEFAAKLEELRAVFADKLVELEEDPKWASEDQREELVKVARRAERPDRGPDGGPADGNREDDDDGKGRRLRAGSHPIRVGGPAHGLVGR